MTDLVRLVWRGLDLGVAPFDISALSGWLGLSGGAYEGQDSTRGHGMAPTPVKQKERVVLASGFLRGGRDTRDGLVSQIQSAMIPARSDDPSTEPLVVTAAGRTATAEAQLINFAVDVSGAWVSGLVPWSAQWRCPDPRVFADPITGTAPLVTNTTGVILPHVMPFTMTAKPIGGQVSLFNIGNDPEGSPVTITLTGAQSGTVGVTNVTTGHTITFGLTLGSADTLVIDSESGGGRLNGEYRPVSGWSDLVRDLRAAPGQNVYRALGAAGAGSPTISVRALPASW